MKLFFPSPKPLCGFLGSLNFFNYYETLKQFYFTKALQEQQIIFWSPKHLYGFWESFQNMVNCYRALKQFYVAETFQQTQITLESKTIQMKFKLPIKTLQQFHKNTINFNFSQFLIHLSHLEFPTVSNHAFLKEKFHWSEKIIILRQ